MSSLRVPFPLMLLFFLGISSFVVSPPDLAAQQSRAQEEIFRRTGQQVSSEEIVQRLEESGMTRAQVRERLSGMGLDPNLADPYFDRMAGVTTDSIPSPEGDFLIALKRLGLAGPRMTGADTLDMMFTGDTLARRVQIDSIPEGDSIPIFGKGVFARHTTQFSPVLAGPVPPDYRLGPGDELQLVLTGDVELAYTLQVSREGAVVIPDVGRVFVNGLTLAELEERLYGRLGRVFSGVGRGADASTQFQVSLGRLRVNQVFVVGEVESPGAHEISSVGTVLTALYRGGGPTMDGSFRRVEVRRGGEVVGVIDLYDYLLRGDVGNDVRLQQGDIVFVPLAGDHVRVTGAVRREAIYEVLAGEGLDQALAFAGGPEPTADLQRVRVEHILPPDQRRSGRERVLEVVDATGAATPGGGVSLGGGDHVRVPTIGEEQKERVALSGFVYRQGDYELLDDMTVADLVDRAGGLRPEAFTPVAHVRRLDPVDSTYALYRVSLRPSNDGIAASDFLLVDQDSVRIFGRPGLQTSDSVVIAGEVKKPGRFGYSRGMTAEDLILMAGGFTERAQGVEVEVSRLQQGIQRSDTISQRYRLAVDDRVPWELGRRVGLSRDTDAEVGEDLPGAGKFELVQGDQVFVRELPGYVTPAAVAISGEIEFPGAYSFTVREERLSSFLARAGGVTADAYVAGIRIVRDSIPVGADVPKALAEPLSPEDPILQPGDRIIVPRFDGTVAVRGAVVFEARVLFRDGKGLDYYLGQAGGTLEEADEDRIYVEYQNGSREATGKTLWIRRYPEIRPGSVISVPVEEAGTPTDWGSIIGTTVSVLATTATLILAIGRL